MLPGFLEKSLFLKRLLSRTIQPQETVNAGRAETMTALTGEISVKIVGPKHIIKMTSIIKNNVIFSLIEVGGVKKIFLMSISRRSGSFGIARLLPDMYMLWCLYHTMEELLFQWKTLEEKENQDILAK